MIECGLNLIRILHILNIYHNKQLIHRPSYIQSLFLTIILKWGIAYIICRWLLRFKVYQICISFKKNLKPITHVSISITLLFFHLSRVVPFNFGITTNNCCNPNLGSQPRPWQDNGETLVNKLRQGRHPTMFPLWRGSAWECKRKSPRFPSAFLLLGIWSFGVFCNFGTRFGGSKPYPNWAIFRPLKISWRIDI
jgi:hypothetical protein